MNTARFVRRAVAAVVVGTVAALLAGCVGAAGGSGSSGEKYEGTVEFWTVELKGCCSDYINGLITTYEKMHPKVTIKWVDVPNADRSTKLLAAIASGKVPDVVNTGDDTTGLFNDSMADLTKYFSPKELATYSSKLLDPLKDSKGIVKGIPWYNGGGSIAYYRKSLVEQAGFDPNNPPKTWDQALDLARAVHQKTGVYGTGVLPVSWVLQSEGIPLVNKDRTKAAFDTPKAVALIEKYKGYYDDGSIAPGAVAADNTTPEQSVYNGQMAFMASDTSTNLAFVQQNAPDIYKDIVVEPAVKGSTGDTLLLGQQIFQIPEASKHKAAAAEWLKFVTNAKNQLALCHVGTILPSTPAALKDPYFTDIKGTDPASQARQVLINDYPQLKAATLGTSNDLYLRQLFDEQIRAVMMGTKTAQQALDEAAKQWDAELAKAAKKK